MADPSRNIDPNIRIKCHICDAFRYHPGMVFEYNVWVCRQCVNYEGTDLLFYTILNISRMKNSIHFYKCNHNRNANASVREHSYCARKTTPRNSNANNETSTSGVIDNN